MATKKKTPETRRIEDGRLPREIAWDRYLASRPGTPLARLRLQKIDRGEFPAKETVAWHEDARYGTPHRRVADDGRDRGAEHDCAYAGGFFFGADG